MAGLPGVQNLAAATVTYNTVQFGGNDADFKSQPPTYRLRGEFVYDDTGRTVKYVRYVLIVNAIFYDNNEPQFAADMEELRNLLSQPAKTLSIRGLGTGFDRTGIRDVNYGPKPLYCEYKPYGPFTYELVWAVEFAVVECASNTPQNNAYLAFNFNTTWINDFEGRCSRTISGHVEYAPIRVGIGGKNIAFTPDQGRELINVNLPIGFRRVRNSWSEGDAKNRLDFVITDEQEPGDPLPLGVISGSGNLHFSSGGPAFEKGQLVLTVQFRVAMGQQPGLGGKLALLVANSKHKRLQDNLAARNKNPNYKPTLIATGMSITNGKYGNARETNATFTWSIVGSYPQAAFDSVELYKPFNGTAQEQMKNWQASVSNSWANRGNSELRSVTEEGFIVDLCTNDTAVSIGKTPQVVIGNGLTEPAFLYACPNIPVDGGWLGHDLRISLRQKTHSSLHRKAISYLPAAVGAVAIGTIGTAAMTLPLADFYFQNQAEKHDVEYHGKPETEALLQFRGLRLGRKPVMPVIKSIGGFPVEPVTDGTVHTARPMFSTMCEGEEGTVWYLNGYQKYRVIGSPATIKPIESMVIPTAFNGQKVDF